MKKIFVILLVLVQCVIAAHAQDYSAPIFRGELAEKYAYATKRYLKDSSQKVAM